MLKGGVQLGAGSEWLGIRLLVVALVICRPKCFCALKRQANDVVLFLPEFDLKLKGLFPFYGERAVDLTLETSIVAEARTLCVFLSFPIRNLDGLKMWNHLGNPFQLLGKGSS